MRLNWFRQAGFFRCATARQLLALWHRLLDNFKLGKVLSCKSNGACPGIVAHESGYIARAGLHRPYRRFPLGLDNFCLARVFHRFMFHTPERSRQAGILILVVTVTTVFCVAFGGCAESEIVSKLLTAKPKFYAPIIIERVPIFTLAPNIKDRGFVLNGRDGHGVYIGKFNASHMVETATWSNDCSRRLVAGFRVNNKSFASFLNFRLSPFTEIISRSLPGVFHIKGSRYCLVLKRESSGGFNKNISAERPLLTVGGGYPLITRVTGGAKSAYSCKNDEAKYEIFERMFLFCLTVTILVAGLWVCCFTSRGRSASYLFAGAILVIIGWCGCLLHDPLFDFIFAESTAASRGFSGVSATCYRRAENVGVAPVVIAPFKFRDVQRQIFAADFVETAHDTAFQQRPEAIDSLSMDGAVDILASAVPNGAVFLQFAISWVFISRNQADFFRDRFADEAVQCFGIRMRNDASHDIAIALDGTDNRFLALSAGSWCALIQCRFLFFPPI